MNIHILRTIVGIGHLHQVYLFDHKLSDKYQKACQWIIGMYCVEDDFCEAMEKAGTNKSAIKFTDSIKSSKYFKNLKEDKKC